jgi:Fe-S-cluster containining protein
MEDEDEIALIPEALVAESGVGMRCEGDRCAALSGDIGVATTCTIYGLRPDVCRLCQPGDPECVMARTRWSLPPLPH